MNLRFAIASLSLCATFSLTGCVGYQTWDPVQRQAMIESIEQEVPGNYFIGRRYYKSDYKFWGYVRKPREQWDTAQLVMFNEHKQLAPDRESGILGSDNGYEYKLIGSFSGDTVYEPASNGFYPEFVLKRAELITPTPGPIFYKNTGALDPARRVIVTPN